MTEKCNPRVERKLWVPHNGGEIAFNVSSNNLRGYNSKAIEILERGEFVPTGDYTASLIYAIYNNDNPEFERIREIVRNDNLWIFNKNIWTPQGVYVLQNENAEGTVCVSTDINSLEGMLRGGEETNGVRFSPDKKLRFAPKGSYVFGVQIPKKLARDGFIIASFGLEGAENFAQVASRLKNNSGAVINDVSKGQEITGSAIGERDCLIFTGDINFGHYWTNTIASAFGVVGVKK